MVPGLIWRQILMKVSVVNAHLNDLPVKFSIQTSYDVLVT